MVVLLGPKEHLQTRAFNSVIHLTQKTKGPAILLYRRYERMEVVSETITGLRYLQSDNSTSSCRVPDTTVPDITIKD